MAELGDEEMNGVVATEIETEEENKFQDIGFYTDENGIKRWGVIPKDITLQTPKVQITIVPNDENRTSNPRYYQGGV